MTIELVVSDWATLVERRADPTAYEIFLTGHSQYSHPATQPFNDPAWPGFWENPDNATIVDKMIAAATDEELQAAIDEWTTLIWTDMPFVKVGDNFVLRARRQEVQGYQNQPDWYFWNVGFSE
jgi:peptide/nickel transport system substrate-binding protein